MSEIIRSPNLTLETIPQLGNIINTFTSQTQNILELTSEFAPLTLKRCYDIAMSNGNITLAEQEILSQMAIEFNLDLSAVSGE